MWSSIKKYFFTAITFFSFNPFGVNSLECVSMNNQECKIRPTIIDVNIMSRCSILSILK